MWKLSEFNRIEKIGGPNAPLFLLKRVFPPFSRLFYGLLKFSPVVPVSISRILKSAVPLTTLSCIECDVIVQKKNERLWTEMDREIAAIASGMGVEEISRMPAIASSRKAYKACGKDPARYRLSAEGLLRRILKRRELYQINNVVDLLNLVSISSGFSIGGYDAGKIEGGVELGIGRDGETYRGIGRGVLNIEHLPVFRDDRGAFGSPTSDSVRTSVGLETQRFLMIIIAFDDSGDLKGAAEMAVNLLRKDAAAKNFETGLIT